MKEPFGLFFRSLKEGNVVKFPRFFEIQNFEVSVKPYTTFRFRNVV